MKSFRLRRSARNKRLISRRGSNRSSKRKFRRKLPSGAEDKNEEKGAKHSPKNELPKCPENGVKRQSSDASIRSPDRRPIAKNLKSEKCDNAANRPKKATSSHSLNSKTSEGGVKRRRSPDVPKTVSPKVEKVDEGANRLEIEEKINSDSIKHRMRPPTQKMMAEVKVYEINRSESVTSSTDTISQERIRKISEKAKSKLLPNAPKANPVSPNLEEDEKEIPEIPEGDPAGPVFDTKSLLMEKTTPLSASFADLTIESSQSCEKTVKSEKKEENLESDSSSVTTECRKVGTH